MENTEMDDLGDNTVDPVDQTTDQTTDQETSFGGDDLLTDQHTEGDIHNESVAIVSGFAPDYSPDANEERLFTIGMLGAGDVDREAMADAPWKSKLLNDLQTKEAILEEVYKVRFRGVYGANTRELLRSLRIDTGRDGKTVTGLSFADKNNKQTEESKYIYSPAVVGHSTGSTRESKDVKKAFTKLLGKVLKDYDQKSMGAEIGRIVGDPQPSSSTDDGGDIDSRIQRIRGGDLMTSGVIDEVSSNVGDALLTRIQSNNDEIERGFVDLRVPFDEWSESMGVFKAGILSQEGSTPTERMNWMDIEISSWEEKVRDETNPDTKELYEAVVRSAKMTKDYIRMRVGLKPEFEDTLVVLKEAVDNSDELRLERFKRWAKKNMVGISAMAISIAGLITGIVMAARGALKVGAKVLGKFAGAVARVLKKLGPVFAALGSLVSTALLWGAKGILWMANNLWFLVVVISAALYSEYGRRRASK